MHQQLTQLLHLSLGQPAQMTREAEPWLNSALEFLELNAAQKQGPSTSVFSSLLVALPADETYSQQLTRLDVQTTSQLL